MGNNYKMVAKTLFGFEDLLERELLNLGAINVKKGVRSVYFEGDKGFMYKANLCLRTALKILKPIKSFRVFNEKDLYKKVYNMDWGAYLTPQNTFAVNASVNSEIFKHSHYIALKVKDAVVDGFREKQDIRPSIDLKHPDLRINIHIQDKECSVSLDSSGASLHHRGYRMATNLAPISEVLAAGIILMSGWDGQSDFYDPMCGSGTLAIEAAMIACNIPANINRREFGFEKWKDFDAELFDKITESCLNKTREFYHKIYASDQSASTLLKAKNNAKNANLSEYITFDRKDFFNSDKPTEEKLHIVFNPPYDERLDIDITTFYKSIGDTLKQNYSNTDAWFITGNIEALKHVGLRPSKKIKLFNGKLESRLVKYAIYEGSKKAKYNN
ncbi:THUMP domain-containing protein [Zhouia spongiae]|uniref:THUMP domain-containing protein n=1 Tax=Zhouia spongiae TaxID=2202721 RepID=A0ABY3YII6_9FLAO|nr:THUMP domain-containing protein [Zhouia spongiae]UNY97508.1 THUMP domain-containing protein [Zhouia spongiae]